MQTRLWRNMEYCKSIENLEKNVEVNKKFVAKKRKARIVCSKVLNI